jgi:hypothetical protein
MGGGSSKAHSYINENDLIKRVDIDEFLNAMGHSLFAFKFHALQGPDGCISSYQASKISTTNTIKLISYDELANLNRLPNNKDRNILKSIETIRFSDSFIVFISHNWPKNDIKTSKLIINDKTNECYNLLVASVKSLIHKYARKMKNCYIFLDFICFSSDGEDVTNRDNLDHVISLCDLVLHLSKRFFFPHQNQYIIRTSST